MTTVEGNDDEQMDIDPDHGLESFEDDDITVLSHTTSIATTPTTTTTISGREPLSKSNAKDLLDDRSNSFCFVVPDNCTNDAAALEHFSRIFHMRYHSTGPILYIGSLDEAIQEALHSTIYNVKHFFFIKNEQNCSHFSSSDRDDH